jgi:hypothetical protein
MKPQPSNPEHKRMKRERKTIGYMVDIYCKGHHGTHGELCSECQEFKDYAFMRLAKCPFQDKKTNLRQMRYPLLPARHEGKSSAGNALLRPKTANLPPNFGVTSRVGCPS